MKKILIVICCIMLLLAGCGSKGDGKSNDNSTVGSDKTGENNSKEVFQYVSNGVPIPLNVDAAPIIKALGEPTSYFEAPSCAFQGLDKVYTYPGFEVNTYPKDDKDYISSVAFMDDTVSTDKGISIGSTLDEVIKAYGEDYKQNLGLYKYTLGDTTLDILIEDDAVASITYSAVIPELQ